jgi:ankyrin repeat protein
MLRSCLRPSPFQRRHSSAPPQDDTAPLHFAALEGWLDVMDKLLDKGADIEAKGIKVASSPLAYTYARAQPHFSTHERFTFAPPFRYLNR